MKTLKSIALACLLAATTFTASSAGEETTAKYSKDEIAQVKKQLEKSISFPENFAGNIKEEQANVLVTISPKGQIKVISINCASDKLKNEIRKQLDNTSIDKLAVSTEQLIRLTINFKQL